MALSRYLRVARRISLRDCADRLKEVRAHRAWMKCRNSKKLPAETAKVTYQLEYGSDSLEIHKDAIQPGQRVIIVDDLLATGGTCAATVQLAKSLGGSIAGLAFVVELDFLNGKEKLKEYDVFSLLHYSY